MAHELGHVIMGRLFGAPGNITIAGLGGQAVGEYGELSAWKRLLVIFAGPCSGFLFVAALTAVDGRPWNVCMEFLHLPSLKCNLFLIDWVHKGLPLFPLMHPRAQYPTYDLVILLLFMINLFMNIMNLLPIIPMDGGMIFKEICVLIAPKSGLKFAYIWSFALATLMTIYLLVVVLAKYKILVPEHYQNYYPFGFPEFSLIIFASLAYQSYQAYRQLAARDRYMDYMQDDDQSGPRRVSGGVVEVEPKDPRDFAPRAPGSERPRS